MAERSPSIFGQAFISPGVSSIGSGSAARADSPASQVPQPHRRLPPTGTCTTTWHLEQVTETVSDFMGCRSRLVKVGAANWDATMLHDVCRVVTSYSLGRAANLAGLLHCPSTVAAGFSLRWSE